MDLSPDSEEFRDLALAEEPRIEEEHGRELTHAPSDVDQNETERIVIDAVEIGPTQQEIEARPVSQGPSKPSMPSPDPASSESGEVSSSDRETDMNQP